MKHKILSGTLIELVSLEEVTAYLQEWNIEHMSMPFNTKYAKDKGQVRPWKRDERFSKSDAVDSEMHIVLDDGVYVVWHGGMNLLGKADIYDNLIRVENEQAAAELLEMTEQLKDLHT